MKIHVSLKKASLAAAVSLLTMGSAMTAIGAAPALTGKVVLRPLTPAEIKTYALTGAQGASGLSAVGVGQPADAVPDDIRVMNGVNLGEPRLATMVRGIGHVWQPPIDDGSP